MTLFIHAPFISKTIDEIVILRSSSGRMKNSGKLEDLPSLLSLSAKEVEFVFWLFLMLQLGVRVELQILMVMLFAEG